MNKINGSAVELLDGLLHDGMFISAWTALLNF